VRLGPHASPLRVAEFWSQPDDRPRCKPHNNARRRVGRDRRLLQCPPKLAYTLSPASKEHSMKQPSIYLKMRVLGAVDTVEGYAAQQT
jgi:hypothetical protein